jgi:hypothetical protein
MGPPKDGAGPFFFQNIMFKIFLKLLCVTRTRFPILGSGSVKNSSKQKMQMIPDPDEVRIGESYQIKGECGPQIGIGSVQYSTDPLLRFQLGPSHVFVRVTGI